MITAMLIVFVLGYLFIALENKIHINKTAIALTLGILLWTLYIFSDPSQIIAADPAAFRAFIAAHPDYAALPLQTQIRNYITNLEIIDQLGNISEILFYLLGAMTIVEVIDSYHGFDAITGRITTRSKKKLLWLIRTGQHDLSNRHDVIDTKTPQQSAGTLDIRKYHYHCSQCRRCMDSHRRCHHHHAVD